MLYLCVKYTISVYKLHHFLQAYFWSTLHLPERGPRRHMFWQRAVLARFLGILTWRNTSWLFFYPPKSKDVITTSKASDHCTCSEEFELHHFRQQMDSLQREVCMPRKLSSGDRSNANIWSAARRCSAYQRGNLENLYHLPVFPFIVLHH